MSLPLVDATQWYLRSVLVMLGIRRPFDPGETCVRFGENWHEEKKGAVLVEMLGRRIIGFSWRILYGSKLHFTSDCSSQWDNHHFHFFFVLRNMSSLPFCNVFCCFESSFDSCSSHMFYFQQRIRRLTSANYWSCNPDVHYHQDAITKCDDVVTDSTV